MKLKIEIGEFGINEEEYEEYTNVEVSGKSLRECIAKALTKTRMKFKPATNSITLVIEKVN